MEQKTREGLGIVKEEPNLEALNITNIVDERACKDIISAFGGDSEVRSSRSITPPNADFLIPVTARAIAEGRSFEMQKVSIRDLKRLKPVVEANAWLISRLSKRLAYKVDKLTQRKATEAVSTAMTRVIDFVETIGEIENPREQFLREIEKLYQEIPLHGTHYAGGPFYSFTRRLDNLHKHPKDSRFKKEYPLIGNALAVSSLRFSDYGIEMDHAAPEVYGGMEVFMQAHGVHVTKTDPHRNQSVTLRAAARLFAGESFEKAEQRIPEVLEAIYQLLPENGPEFKQKLQGFATNIIEAKKQGATNQEISQALFKSII